MTFGAKCQSFQLGIFEMKKSTKSHAKQNDSKPTLSRKELIKQIAADNRAYFEKEESKQSPQKTDNGVWKVICANCGAHVEYQSSAAGASIPCPHCGTSVFLKFQEAWRIKKEQHQEMEIRNMQEDWHTRKEQIIPTPKSNLPSTSTLESQVWQSIQDTFSKKPATANTQVKGLTLINESGNKYKGLLKLQTGQATENVDIEVVYDGASFIWKILSGGSQPANNEALDTIGGIALLLFIGGIVCIIYFFYFYATANPGAEYVNLERLNTRQDGIIIGVGASVVGVFMFIILLFLAAGNQNNSKAK